ncbi:complement factor H-like isoform X2 [Scomber japonicus]|uniref:complement factor H-like isoform X2 n=1 Tax=Scomber japonicus TaxID=13676 RepID=UPI002305B15F|nr:complement factor H-like isoform X2 [Scomber japonicus]
MCVRYLGFLLLIWFPGALHALSGQQNCRAPKLDHGYLVPDEESYTHETNLTYACDKGHKPVVEGWWARSTCQDGKWSHEPQCIDENACIPPTILNAKYTENSNGWYENGHKIRIICAIGYEHKNFSATAECTNGTWSSLPVCEKQFLACGEPPEIPHAVIIHEGYQDVFAADSVLQYECEEGFTVEGVNTNKTIICISGKWSTASPCHSRPDAGRGGSAAGGGGSSSSSGGNDREGGHQITTINNCGRYPRVSNGDVVERGPMFLKYQCSSFYKRVGPQKVMCYSDGTWSPVPTCKAAFCEVDTADYRQLENAGIKFIGDGQKGILKCDKLEWYWIHDHYSEVQCTDGRIRLGKCCSWLDGLRQGC